MKTLDKGADKIQKISDILRRETLEPAEAQAQEMITAAEKERDELIAAGRAEAARIEQEARQRMAKERSVFESSLDQAMKQSVEALRQEIEKRLFDGELGKLLSTATSDPQLIANLINAMVGAIEKEGTSADLAALIPQVVKADAVNALLLKNVADLLREKGVTVGNFGGGAQIKLQDAQVTIDLSDEALRELLSRYLRKDFRALLFGEGK